MGLKILHSADWHLDSPFSGFPEAAREQLRRVQRRLPEQIVRLCREENCDILLLAGDVFDGTPSRETVAGLKSALGSCGVPVFISPGNHDFCGPGSPWLEESWPDNVHVFTGGVEPVVLPELNCRVYGAGYRSMDCPGLLEGFRAEGEERYCLGVFHADPTQRSSPYSPVTAAQIRDSGFDYLALGHIHKAGALRCGATLCAWPGCPMGRGWDETGETGVYLVTLEETAAVRKLPLDTVRFYDLEVQIGADPVSSLEAALPAAADDHFYRVTLKGRGSVDLPKLKARFSGFANLQLLDETRPPLPLWEQAGEDTLRGVYFRLLREAAQEDPKNADRIRLAAEISQMLLQGEEVALP